MRKNPSQEKENSEVVARELKDLRAENDFLKMQMKDLLGTWRNITEYHEMVMASGKRIEGDRSKIYKKMLKLLFLGSEQYSENSNRKFKSLTVLGRPQVVLKAVRSKNSKDLKGCLYFYKKGMLRSTNFISFSSGLDQIFGSLDTNLMVVNLKDWEHKTKPFKNLVKEIVGQLEGIKNYDGSTNLTNFIAYKCVYDEHESFVLAINYNNRVSDHDATLLRNFVITVESMYSFFNRVKDLQSASLEMISRIELLARKKDPETTGNHVVRMAAYSSIIADELRQSPKYNSLITEGFVEDIGYMAALHDIGKVGIPDAILNKPGRLTDEEFDIMKEHTTIGGACLEGSRYLRMAWEIAICHHERMDGNGYPRGLDGSQIPISAKIVAVADVYDALSTERPYKKEYSHEKSISIIKMGVGTQFDPDVFEAFSKAEDRILQIKVRFKERGCITENDVVDGHKVKFAG